MLAVFVTFEVALFVIALVVLGWALPLVILAAVVLHVLALFALMAVAAAKGRSPRPDAGQRRVKNAQAGRTLSPLPPRDS